MNKRDIIGINVTGHILSAIVLTFGILNLLVGNYVVGGLNIAVAALCVGVNIWSSITLNKDNKRQ